MISLEIAVGVVAVSWGVIAFLFIRIEKTRDDGSKRVAELHRKVDAQAKEFIRRDDALLHFQRIEQALTQMQSQQSQALTQMNQQLDNVLHHFVEANKQ